MAGIMNKLKDMWSPAEDEADYSEDSYYDNETASDDSSYNGYDEYDTYDEPELQPQRPVSRAPQQSNNKVVNIHATARLQVVLVKPERFGDEIREIADELMNMHTVLLNLENTNKDMARRIIDFLSGAAYANSGKINRVATNTYIITPNNVELTGNDLLDELESNGIYF